MPGGRVSKLYASNDAYIDNFLKDPNYKVDEKGNVYSKISKQGHPLKEWRLLKPVKHRTGYLKINYKNKCLQIHRIIYAAFLGILVPYMVINHKDGDGTNNQISNLELITQSENLKHKYRTLKSPPTVSNAKITQEIADEIRRQVTEENIKAVDLARKYGLGKSTINSILRNKSWKRDK